MPEIFHRSPRGGSRGLVVSCTNLPKLIISKSGVYVAIAVFQRSTTAWESIHNRVSSLRKPASSLWRESMEATPRLIYTSVEDKVTRPLHIIRCGAGHMNYITAGTEKIC